MKIYGYKAFNSDLSNRYGVPFEVGKLYTKEGEIKFGNTGNGFHICTKLEDALRYFDFMNDQPVLCRVEGSGQLVNYDDDYYGYFDMYVVSELKIISVMSKKEIIEEILKEQNIDRIYRFISGYKLTYNDLKLFSDRWPNDLKLRQYINYYQLNDKEAFNKTR